MALAADRPVRCLVSTLAWLPSDEWGLVIEDSLLALVVLADLDDCEEAPTWPLTLILISWARGVYDHNLAAEAMEGLNGAQCRLLGCLIQDEDSWAEATRDWLAYEYPLECQTPELVHTILHVILAFVRPTVMSSRSGCLATTIETLDPAGVWRVPSAPPGRRGTSRGRFRRPRLTDHPQSAST